MAHSNLLHHHCCGLMAHSNLLHHHCCGLMAHSNLLYHHHCGLMAYSNLLHHHHCGLTAHSNLFHHHHCGWWHTVVCYTIITGPHFSKLHAVFAVGCVRCTPDLNSASCMPSLLWAAYDAHRTSIQQVECRLYCGLRTMHTGPQFSKLNAIFTVASAWCTTDHNSARARLRLYH